jgi:hypothetical protein
MKEMKSPLAFQQARQKNKKKGAEPNGSAPFSH